MTTMTTSEYAMLAAQLKRFALDSYTAGGHWIYETTSQSEYIAILEEAQFDLRKAQKALKKEWELMNQMHSNTRFE